MLSRSSLLSAVTLSVFASLGMMFCPQTVRAAVTDYALSLKPGLVQEQILKESVTGIGFTLTQAGTVSVQTLEGSTWSAWHTVNLDADAWPYLLSTELVFTNDAVAVRVRSEQAMQATLHGISTSSEPIRTLVAGARSLAAPVVIPRWQWGADESLRTAHGAPSSVHRAESFDEVGPDRIQYCSTRSALYPDEFREVNRKFYDEEGNPLWWPVGYSDEIHMFIIHHTASPIGDSKKSGVERLRAIYQYHAVTRKWGDIGYNYIIDHEGNMYEGRAGGEKAVGAHAYCNNVGTIGISLMGNFQIERPTDAQLQSLRYLLSTLSKDNNIDPTGTVQHHGKLLPTIIVHREVGQTACAGQYLNELLPQIRAAVKQQDFVRPIFSTNAKPSTKSEAALIGYPENIALNAGERKTFTVKYMNMGMEPWTQKTWLLGEADDIFFTQYLPYSYVAGFLKEEEVKPGEVGTFEVSMQAGVAIGGGHRNVRLTPVVNNERRLIRNVANLSANLKPGDARFTYVTSYFPSLHLTGEDLTGIVKIFNGGSVPWEKDTITGLRFDIENALGEISILEAPQRVDPGKQGSFTIRFLNVNEEGKYEREVVPRMIGGAPIVGSAIHVASRAEPMPEITYGHAAGMTEVLAQSQQAFERGRATTVNDVSLETTIGTTLTLAPGEQVRIPVRIRAGKSGIAKDQVLADIILSSNTVILRDNNNRRVRNIFRSPFGLLKYQTELTELMLKAPQREGSYSFSIGDITFDLAVRKLARQEAKENPQALLKSSIASRTAARSRSLIRQQRQESNAPVTPSTNTKTNVRIRLNYEKDFITFDAAAPIFLQGNGGIINTSGKVRVDKDREFCSVVTTNGRVTDPIVRFWTGEKDGLLQVTSLDRAANEYRGVIECRIINGTLTLINELPIEDYLAGLSEEPDSEPWEKQRAFAIAARSYALYYTIADQTKFPGMPFNGSDSPREFQAYGGAYFEKKNPQWAQAVRDTAGKVLTYQGLIIKPPYHSGNDGRTRSAFEVWGWMHTPYLPSVPDPGCVNVGNSGHLVGMSGCGAEAKANAGEKAEAILGYYYPETRILPYDNDRVTGVHTK